MSKELSYDVFLTKMVTMSGVFGDRYYNTASLPVIWKGISDASIEEFDAICKKFICSFREPPIGINFIEALKAMRVVECANNSGELYFPIE